jgi:hypothetical protein
MKENYYSARETGKKKEDPRFSLQAEQERKGETQHGMERLWGETCQEWRSMMKGC